MTPFRFCPDCGCPTRPAGAFSSRCDACGRSWYLNSAPSVGCGIVRAGRALVTVRGREPERGKLDVPGGFLHPEEHPLAGLRREVREELGVEIEVGDGDLLTMATHRYGTDGGPVLALGFRARIVAGEPEPSDDVAGIRWVAADELDGLAFAWSHDRELVRRALRLA